MNSVRTIDVAHPPRLPAAVESTLLEEWGFVRNSTHERILKVVHGYGSSGQGGRTRDTVRNWLFAQRGRFRGVIAGEDCSPSNARLEAMVKATGYPYDPDLLKPNPGVTFVWIR
jgi:hypothetical protein